MEVRDARTLAIMMDWMCSLPFSATCKALTLVDFEKTALASKYIFRKREKKVGMKVQIVHGTPLRYCGCEHVALICFIFTTGSHLGLPPLLASTSK